MKKLTDQQLENIMAMLATESSTGDLATKEIADSPQLWWAVQRNIALERSAVTSPWPPPKTLFRWFAIGLPSLAVLAIAVTYFTLVRNDSAAESVNVVTNQMSERTAVPLSTMEEPLTGIVGVKNASHPKIFVTWAGTERRADRVGARDISASIRKAKAKPATATEEIRSDFIALTYGGRPDSGHIVRVKVPSSMMVNLGLVDSVQKPSSLVNAEVVVGDDGQTHAIRFISRTE